MKKFNMKRNTLVFLCVVVLQIFIHQSKAATTCFIPPTPRNGGIVHYDRPPTHSTHYAEGTVATLSCPDDLVLHGPRITTCTSHPNYGSSIWSGIMRQYNVSCRGPCESFWIYNKTLRGEVIKETGSFQDWVWGIDPTYYVGTVIRGSCAPGYGVTGNSTNVCTRHGWLNPIFICEEKCPDAIRCKPWEGLNGEVVTNYDKPFINGSCHWYPWGTKVFYSCQPGWFFNNGTTKETCDGHYPLNSARYPGVWTLDNGKFPQCIGRQCRSPHILGWQFNGTISYSKLDINGGYSIGTVAKFKCYPGYYLYTGTGSMMCTRKFWVPSPTENVCLKEKCPALPISDLRIFYVRYDKPAIDEDASDVFYPLGTKVKFNCSYSSKVQFEFSATCTSDEGGMWIHEELFDRHCGVVCAPLNVPNGQVTYDRRRIFSAGYVQGTTANITCDPGFHTVISSTTTCTYSSYFDGRCRQGTCPPIRIDNGTMQYSTTLRPGGYRSGTVANITCDTGYNLIGSNSTTCQGGLSNGSAVFVWTSPPPMCELVTCPSLSLSNGKIHYTLMPVNGRYQPDTIAFFECDCVFFLTGSRFVACQSSIGWSQEIPRCYRGCQGFYRLRNTTVTYSNTPDCNGVYPQGTTASFTCNPGLARSGPSSGVCEFGHWNEIAPRCYEVTFPELPRACFPSMANVWIEKKGRLMMSDLQIGDKVRSVVPNGKMTYSKVLAFLQRDPDVVAKYQSITTLNNEYLALSASHLLYARKYGTDEFYLIYADEVSVGDEILIDKNGGIMPTKVFKVSSMIMKGVHVPLTTEGNIVVNGILASCFASVNNDLAHIGMAPIQWFPDIVQWLFGEDGGILAFVKINKELSKWMLPYGQLWL